MPQLQQTKSEEVIPCVHTLFAIGPSAHSWGGLCLAALTASATIQQHTFTIAGNNGETGIGTFTWDDAVVANGSDLSLWDDGLSPNVLSINITVSGGNVVGGSTTFTKANCTRAYLQKTPDFRQKIAFGCDNGTNQLTPLNFFGNYLNVPSSELTYTPG